MGDLSIGLRARVSLERNGIRPSHSLGQNFLLDENLLNALLEACGASAEDAVLEIGPGAGTMTALLAERTSRVVAVEVDTKLRPVLEDVLAGCENVHLVFGDFLRLDADRLVAECFGDGPYRVIANLPYYITSDILLRLAEMERAPQSIAVMVQREAAERLMSEPGDRQWCATAALVRLYGTAEMVMEVPPDAFDPPPHVDSCFLWIRRHGEPIVRPRSMKALRQLIQRAFAMRRKTLANNLRAGYGFSAEDAAGLLAECGLEPKVRGETLTLEQLSDLSDRICDRLETAGNPE